MNFSWLSEINHKIFFFYVYALMHNVEGGKVSCNLSAQANNYYISYPIIHQKWYLQNPCRSLHPWSRKQKEHDHEESKYPRLASYGPATHEPHAVHETIMRPAKHIDFFLFDLIWFDLFVKFKYTHTQNKNSWKLDRMTHESSRAYLQWGPKQSITRHCENL